MKTKDNIRMEVFKDSSFNKKIIRTKIWRNIAQHGIIRYLVKTLFIDNEWKIKDFSFKEHSIDHIGLPKSSPDK